MKITSFIYLWAVVAIDSALAQESPEDADLITRDALMGKLKWNPTFGTVGAGALGNPANAKQKDKKDKKKKKDKDDDDSDEGDKKSEKKSKKKEDDDEETTVDRRDFLDDVDDSWLYERDLFDLDDDFDFSD